MVPREKPSGRSGFEASVGEEICPAVATDRDVVEQTLAKSLLEDVEAVHRHAGGRVVEEAGVGELGPGSLRSFIGVRPTRRPQQVCTRVDQLKAGAAAVRVFAPASSAHEGDFGNHRMKGHRIKPSHCIGDRQGLSRGEREASARWDLLVEASHGVVEVQIWIIRQELASVARDHEIAASRDRGAGRNLEVDSIHEAPPLQVHRLGGLIEKLDVLVVRVARNRRIHNLVDNHILRTPRRIGRTRCGRRQSSEGGRAVGCPSVGDVGPLILVIHRVDGASSVAR